ncbi:MAG: DUF4476 domain-containing protein [Verrucomicrobia bacterium]|nr:DUF4476 domain-containing protein [Cytophagales bacterium]
MKNSIFSLFLAIFLSAIVPALAQESTRCTVSNTELQTMQSQIRSAESALNPENQANLAESIFREKSGCFTSLQIKAIVKSVVSPENQLAIAKLGYDHVADPANYSVVGGAFRFPTEMEAFKEFLN